MDADGWLRRVSANPYMCPPRTEAFSSDHALHAFAGESERCKRHGASGMLLVSSRPSWNEVTTRHNFNTCWKGYERVPGTKRYADDSCRKKSGGDSGSSSSSESDGGGGRRKKKSKSQKDSESSQKD